MKRFCEVWETTGFRKCKLDSARFTCVRFRVIFDVFMFIFQAAELLAVLLLTPGILPENLQTSKAVRNSSYSLDMVSFWGTLPSVISQQQLKANNYNLLVTLVTFFFSCTKWLSIYLRCKFYEEENIFFLNLFFSENKKYMFFSSLTEMLKKKPSASQASTGPSPTMHTTFPRPHSLYSLGSRRDFDLPMEHSTKYIRQFCKYNGFRMDIQVSENLYLSASNFIKISSY